MEDLDAKFNEIMNRYDEKQKMNKAYSESKKCAGEESIKAVTKKMREVIKPCIDRYIARLEQRGHIASSGLNQHPPNQYITGAWMRVVPKTQDDVGGTSKEFTLSFYKSPDREAIEIKECDRSYNCLNRGSYELSKVNTDLIEKVILNKLQEIFAG